MCCGQKRAEIRSNMATAQAHPLLQSAPVSTPAPGFRRQSDSARASQQLAPSQAPLPAPPAAVPPVSDLNGSVMIRYVEQSPIRVQGLQTGRSYDFSLSSSVQAVDSRDASTLLATRFFRRA